MMMNEGSEKSGLAGRIAALSPAKKALLQRRLAQSGRATPQAEAIPKLAHAGDVPLSFAQERLWFLDRWEPGSSRYNLPVLLRITGSLDRAVLEQSLNEILRRHEALRASFVEEQGQPVQRVADEAALRLQDLDLTGLPEETRFAEAYRRGLEDAMRPFDLAEGPLLRAAVFRLGPKEWLLVLALHHIATDGWSQGVLFRELSLLYSAFTAGQPSPLPELPIQYRDFALWQRQRLAGETLDQELSYWKEKLRNLALLELPADHPRPPQLTYRGARKAFTLPSSSVRELQSLSRREGVTLFMTLLAAFQTLLYRYTGEPDIAVGSPIAGRGRAELEPLIGFFVNTLVLRTSLAGDPDFRELLSRVRETALGAYAHQDLPFEKLVDELKPERDPSRNPLFQVMFVLQNTPDPVLRLRGLEVELLRAETATAKFDLTVFLAERAGSLEGEIEYNTDLFEADTIERIIGHFQVLLEGIAANPGQKISQLPLLTPAERRQILIDWNDTAADYPADSCIHELFEAQAKLTPEAVAVVFEDQTLTYRELDDRAERLALRLKEHGVGPEALVGICMERSPDMIVGLLGILKAGAAYVPLDPHYPKERLAFMLADCRSPLLITQSSLLPGLPEARPAAICLDAEPGGMAPQAAGKTSFKQSADSLAYVNYTSGSTGVPKGVLITHRGVVRLLFGVDYAGFSGSQTFLHLSTLSFDASTFEIWGALLHGGTCVLFPERVPTVDALERAIRQHRVDTLWLTSSLFNTVIDVNPRALEPVKQLLIGGEALSPEHVRRALQALPGTEISNGYGPTEGTTFTCCYRIPRELEGKRRTIPVGRPISNTRVYVLDANRQPVPVGIPGELYIGGDGLARSYLGRPELTEASFVEDPFSAGAGSRLYRSGDRVRWLSDGNLEFLGRLDRQIKIRGYRIEPEEIESVLEQHPRVIQAAVAAQEGAPGDRRLTAYIVGARGGEESMSAIREYAKGKLPDYMVPSLFVAVENLPLTSSGKLDREALPHCEILRQGDPEAFAAPRDQIEKRVAALMEEMLSVPVGLRDDFFEAGGHSLLAIKFLRRIEEAFGKRVPVASLFQDGTVEHIAELLRAGSFDDGGGSLVEIRPGRSKPPLYLVHGLGGELPWRQLIRYIEADRGIYGLQPPERDGIVQSFPDLRLMAEHYADCLCRGQQDEPFHIAGYSYGGKVALEIAQQLLRRGRKVGLLAIIDTGPGVARKKSVRGTVLLAFYFLRNLPFWVRDDLLKTSVGYMMVRIRRVVRALFKHIGSKLAGVERGRIRIDFDDFFDDKTYEGQDRTIAEANLKAWQRYEASPYPGRVTLLRARTRPLLHSLEPDLRWSGIARGGLDIRSIPGYHGNIIWEPNVRHLAAELNRALESIEAVRH